jgi:hypothetical protein
VLGREQDEHHGAQVSGCWFSVFEFEIGLLRNVSKSMLADQSKTQNFGVDKKRVAAAAEEPFLTTG